MLDANKRRDLPDILSRLKGVIENDYALQFHLYVPLGPCRLI